METEDWKRVDMHEEEPVPPLTRYPQALLDGKAYCHDCGKPLIGAKDALGDVWYVHGEQITWNVGETCRT